MAGDASAGAAIDDYEEMLATLDIAIQEAQQKFLQFNEITSSSRPGPNPTAGRLSSLVVRSTCRLEPLHPVV